MSACRAAAHGATRDQQRTAADYPKGSPERRAYWSLIARGIPAPTSVQVREEVDRDAAARAVRADRVAQAHALISDAGPTAAQLVRHHVAEHGTGPCWSQLAHLLGFGDVPRPLRVEAIRQLAFAGWLVYGDAAGSTRPGPNATPGP